MIAVMRTNALLVLLALALCSPTARADGTTRVAVIDTTRVFGPSGISTWTQARARLDAEKATFVVVESPDGRSEPKYLERSNLPPETKKRLVEVYREGARMRGWTAHVEDVLGPIRAAALADLATFASARKIDLVIDRAELPAAVLVAGPGVDITDAFIKDYNARQAKR